MTTSKETILNILAIILPLGLGCALDDQKVSELRGMRIAPETHYAAGRMLEGQNKYLGAIDQYQKVIKAHPQSPQAYNRIALINQKLNQPGKAQKILQEGIEANPQSAVLRNNFGFCCLLRNDYATAEKQFRKALELSPTFQRARMNLAIALTKDGQLREGVQQFKQVVSEEAAYYNVATICMEKKKYADAEWALRNALAINPDDGPANAYLELVTAKVNHSTEDRTHALAKADPSSTKPPIVQP